MKLTVTSPAFKEGEMIPVKYTGDADNISPELNWQGAPAGTKSFALISDDPDAPMGTWVHWVAYNIPASETGLAEGVKNGETLENGMKQGKNSGGKTGYSGPRPPSGTHRYYFKVYALDTAPDLKPGATKEQLLAAIKGHVLAEGELMGRYKR